MHLRLDHVWAHPTDSVGGKGWCAVGVDVTLGGAVRARRAEVAQEHARVGVHLQIRARPHRRDGGLRPARSSDNRLPTSVSDDAIRQGAAAEL